MDIYEKIRYYREHTDFSQRNVAQILGISRNTVKKYWEGQTVPWERKPGSGRKKDIITDEVKAFIMKCLDSDRKAPRKQQHTAHKIYTRLVAECGFEGCEGCEGYSCGRYCFNPYCGEEACDQIVEDEKKSLQKEEALEKKENELKEEQKAIEITA